MNSIVQINKPPVSTGGFSLINKDGSMKTGKVGEAVVSGYKKIEYAFVNTFIAKEGETVEDAKARISGEQNSKDSE